MERSGRQFAVFDIDGTLIRWQLYHAIVDELGRTGLIDKEDFKRVKDERLKWKSRAVGASFKKYEQVLVDVYISNLGHISPDQISAAANEVFIEYKDQVYTYTRDLIKRLKDEGYMIFAISGSHSEIISQIAQHYGFDDAVGAEFVKKDGKFTGKVRAGYHNKNLTLKKLIDRHGVTYEGSIAVGDSLSDAKMMDLVQKPIAFNPDADLLTYSRQKGWPIVIERKNVIYQLRKNGSTYVLA